VPSVTITNRELSLEDPSWVCYRLDTLETTARTIYYTARLLRYLEVLAL
jgi:hypothetical protein